MRQFRIAAVLGLLAALSATLPAEGGVYRFEDGTGAVHYTNVPADPRYRFFDPPEPAPPAEREARVAAPVPWTQRFGDLIRAAVERHRVDRGLVEAVIAVESAGNPGAISRKGALGLMQLMPQRAAELGVRNPFDPQQNIEGGVRHLRELLQRFAGNLTLALAAYNAGEAAVRAYQGVPPYQETQDYVRKVRARYSGSGILAGAGAGAGTPEVVTAPQEIYRQVADDGTVTFTNIPPSPPTTARRRF